MPSSSIKCFAPNRYHLAVAGLLVIMGVSIALAIIFPYHAQQQQAIEQSASSLRGTVPPATTIESGGIVGDEGMTDTSGIGNNGGVEEVGSGVGIGGLVVDDSVFGESSVAVAQTDVVSEEVSREYFICIEPD